MKTAIALCTLLISMAAGAAELTPDGTAIDSDDPNIVVSSLTLNYAGIRGYFETDIVVNGVTYWGAADWQPTGVAHIETESVLLKSDATGQVIQFTGNMYTAHVCVRSGRGQSCRDTTMFVGGTITAPN